MSEHDRDTEPAPASHPPPIGLSARLRDDAAKLAAAERALVTERRRLAVIEQVLSRRAAAALHAGGDAPTQLCRMLAQSGELAALLREREVPAERAANAATVVETLRRL